MECYATPWPLWRESMSLLKKFCKILRNYVNLAMLTNNKTGSKQVSRHLSIQELRKQKKNPSKPKVHEIHNRNSKNNKMVRS